MPIKRDGLIPVHVNRNMLKFDAWYIYPVSTDEKIQVGGGSRSKQILGLSSAGVGIRENAYGPSSGGRIWIGKVTAGPLSTATVAEPRAGMGRLVGRFTAFGRNVVRSFPFHFYFSVKKLQLSNHFKHLKISPFNGKLQGKDSRRKKLVFTHQHLKNTRPAHSFLGKSCQFLPPFFFVHHRKRKRKKNIVVVYRNRGGTH